MSKQSKVKIKKRDKKWTPSENDYLLATNTIAKIFNSLNDKEITVADIKNIVNSYYKQAK